MAEVNSGDAIHSVCSACFERHGELAVSLIRCTCFSSAEHVDKPSISVRVENGRIVPLPGLSPTPIFAYGSNTGRQVILYVICM